MLASNLCLGRKETFVLSQKTAQNEPEKKMPSTAAKATMRSAKDERSASHQRRAQSAFFLTCAEIKRSGE